MEAVALTREDGRSGLEITHLEKHPEALLSSAPPEVWGPVFWGELDEVCGKIPCSHCSGECKRWLSALRDLVNSHRGRPFFNRKNVERLHRELVTALGKHHRLGEGRPGSEHMEPCRGRQCQALR